MIDLSKYIAQAITIWHHDHRDVTTEQVLFALEELRYKLTEDLLRVRQK